MKKYRMAAYCRLSREDGESKLSESIENQLSMIYEFVEESVDLEIADKYIDDGYSGLYFDNRPEFQRMMRDIYDGKVDGVITKDISRLGRELIETSNYRERVFPSLGVRYIAILDGVDSISQDNEELAQFKTLFNDMYCRDISKKIKSSLTAQKKKGRYMSGLVPYGYIKDPMDKHHLVIDEEAAMVVREIFSLYLNGYSRAGISKILNKKGIITPSEYKRQVLGIKYKNSQEKSGPKGWAYPTVDVILRNRIYTGDIVQHKTEKISYKVNKERYISKDKQIIVENTHEAIIGKDTFNLVQDLMKKRSRTPGFHNENKKINPYAGILVCGDCGYNLLRVTCRDGYDCATYHSKGNKFCKSHFVSKKLLDDIVKEEIQKQARMALKEQDKSEILKAAARSRKHARKAEITKMQVERLRKELEDVKRYRRKTYESFMDGILDKQEYISYKNDYEKQAEELNKKIEEFTGELEKSNEDDSAYETWIEKFINYGEIEEIAREVVVELLDKIVVYGEQKMDVVFRYKSPYGE